MRGGLGDVKVKKFLYAILEELLTPIRERRKEWEKDIPAVFDILKRGSEAAREVAAGTLADVRRAMRIDYFDDAELIAEQSRKFQG
jgi:tryptophanyl-tRNA synthetase